jgi:hypothetical protein
VIHKQQLENVSRWQYFAISVRVSWLARLAKFFPLSFLSPPPFFSFSLPLLWAHATPAVAGRVANSFILSSFCWLTPVVRQHGPVLLPNLLSVDYRPLCFPCWLAFPAQLGYLLRSVRRPSPLLCVQYPSYFAHLCGFLFLSWFLLFMVAVLVHIVRGVGIRGSYLLYFSDGSFDLR